MTRPLLQIFNAHTASCGEPPFYRADDRNLYLGCFQNLYGEQWVFTFDRTTKTAELRGGDIGWNHVIPVIDGKAKGVTLTDDELAWLKCCWHAATANS